MRKIIPFIAAGIIFLAAVALIQPAPSTEVVVAAKDMFPSGRERHERLSDLGISREAPSGIRTRDLQLTRLLL